MRLAGTYTFDVPSEALWDSLMDPTKLATVIPGCEKLEAVGPDEYTADLKIRVGPVQSQFKGRIKITDKSPQDSFNIQLSGIGPSGTVDGAGSIQLTPQNGVTLLAYDGEAQVGGRIASVGSRVLTSTAKAITQQSLDGLHERLKQPETVPAAVQNNGAIAPVKPSSSPAPVAEQSQTEFAVAVFKDVYDDLVPQAVRPVVTVGIVAGAILLIQWWISLTVERAVERAIARRK